MPLKVIQLVSTPTTLVNAAIGILTHIPTVDTIVFTDEGPCKHYLGTLFPYLKLIEIYLGPCVYDTRFLNMGLYTVPGVFLNALFAVYHEAEHAVQLTQQPEMIQYTKLPQAYERLADRAAYKHVQRWLQQNSIPPIETYGHMRPLIVEIMQTLEQKNAKWKHMVNEERIAYHHGVQARLSTLLDNEHLNQEQYDRLCTLAHEGSIGQVINGKEYLTAAEALAYLIPDPGTLVTPFDKPSATKGVQTMDQATFVSFCVYTSMLLFNPQYSLTDELKKYYGQFIEAITPKLFKNGTVPGVDMVVNINGRTYRLRILQQNPAKPSTWGQLARKGHQICWVIDQTNDAFLGHVENGQWEASKPRVTEAGVTFQAGAGQPSTEYDLPEVNMEDILDHVDIELGSY